MDNFRDTDQTSTLTSDKYLKLKDLSAYSGISVRKLRDFIRDSEYPLPSFRMEGMILVKQSEFDGWMERYFRLRKTDLDQIVDEVVSGL